METTGTNATEFLFLLETVIRELETLNSLLQTQNSLLYEQLIIKQQELTR